MTIYRKRGAARSAADYRGAMLAGGRWNPIDTPMPYAHSTFRWRAWRFWFTSTKANCPVVTPGRRQTCRKGRRFWTLQHPVRLACAKRPEKVWIETANALLFRSLRHDRRRIQCAGEPQASRLQCLTWAEPRLFSFDPRLITAGPQTSSS